MLWFCQDKQLITLKKLFDVLSTDSRLMHRKLAHRCYSH